MVKRNPLLPFVTPDLPENKSQGRISAQSQPLPLAASLRTLGRGGGVGGERRGEEEREGEGGGSRG